MTKLRRTVLYVPADNRRALEKALTLPADALIIDLEDAVAPDKKDIARDNLRTLPRFDREVALRVNSPETAWHFKDLTAARAKNFHAIVLPKTKSAMEVTRLATRTGHTVWPMIETARGVLDARPIAEAAAGTGPAALIFGTNDLCAELGITPGGGRMPLRMAMQQLVLAGAAHGVDVIDGVVNNFKDLKRLKQEAMQARGMGMAGKTIIHPHQIEEVNRIFTPTVADYKRAERIIAAMKKAEGEGKSVATLNGRMVEQLHARAAEKLLEKVRLIGERGETATQDDELVDE
ncbi:MAG: CoA ester lyase [Pseudomonadota bacterium]